MKASFPGPTGPWLPRRVVATIMIVLAACSTAESPAPQRDDINASFKDPEADARRWVNRFEIESREVFRHRHDIVDALDLAPGTRVADVGAGTGLFVALFADTVGAEGRVFGVDISPSLVDHMKRRFADRPEIEVVASEERSTLLEAGSVDVVFSSDTYHHFTYFEDMLASMLQAIAPGGRMYVLDFKREPGVSADWILGHVRAGKQQVIREIEAAGFRFEGEIEVDGLVENYLLRFSKP